ncbi:hypothetical protein [Myxococcus landrumensis]|uniref:Lipoprotein n=1 Tax=Myxococcus landrumensis TaxID=2813577 RepID=A0ABX7N7R2_9BACT|nr:hypothetical protein [Myxococcus landrumus]QSQ14786.1 hypothetical protein JY572_01465 [Myxococcus landrumus]
MHQCFRLLLALAIGITLTACQTYTATRYAVSSDNVQTLRTLRQKYPSGSINVASFSAKDGPLREIACRGAGPVAPPDQKTFEQYVQAALVDDLKMAEVYSDKSRVALSASIQSIDFSSTSGTWTLAALVSTGKQSPFAVSHTANYSSSFMGDNACMLTAQAFMPAVQDFLKKLIASPEFEKAFSDSSTTSPPTAEPIPGS